MGLSCLESNSLDRCQAEVQQGQHQGGWKSWQKGQPGTKNSSSMWGWWEGGGMSGGSTCVYRMSPGMGQDESGMVRDDGREWWVGGRDKISSVMGQLIRCLTGIIGEQVRWWGMCLVRCGM